VRVLPISEKTLDVAEAAAAKLADAGVRLTVDRSSDKIGAKIRNARLDRVPYMLVIGQREAEEGTVSVRHRDKDDLGAKPLESSSRRSPRRSGIPHHQSGLPILEPVLHQHLRRFFQQTLEQCLCGVTHFLFLGLGHFLLFEQVVDLQLVFG
jgi:hypothetical protein